MDRRFLSVSASLVMALLFSGCPVVESENAQSEKKPAAAEVDQGLLTAYFLLEDTLSQEKHLGALGFLKKITFSRPVPEIEELMHRLADLSKELLDELEELRKLPPDVSAAPNDMDPIGDAITSNATGEGVEEMLNINGSFGIRFILLQAQATRMVSAIALAAVDLETNERRKKWLKDVARDFESIRDELVVIVEKYVLQEGAAQQED